MADSAEKARRNRHAQAQLGLFRAWLEHGEALQKVAAAHGIVSARHSFEQGSTYLHSDGRVEFTYQDEPYRLDQIPGLIEALERALDEDRRQARKELGLNADDGMVS